MCEYIIIAKDGPATVRYCFHCKTYSLAYENILLNMSENGMEDFKNCLLQCYDYHLCHQDQERFYERDIRLNTKVDGLQMMFSLAELSQLIAILQEAQFACMGR
ncbi:MAG: DUF6686 family protein [Bacteroidota bacterium]